MLQGVTVAKCSNKAVRPTAQLLSHGTFSASQNPEDSDVTLKPVFPASFGTQDTARKKLLPVRSKG